MLNCRDTSRLLSQSQDRPLAFRERLSLSFHLSMCGACNAFARQLRFLRRTATALEGRILADNRLQLGTQARERIKLALRGDGENDAAG